MDYLQVQADKPRYNYYSINNMNIAATCADPEGVGAGGPDPLKNKEKYMVS